LTIHVADRSVLACRPRPIRRCRSYRSWCASTRRSTKTTTISVVRGGIGWTPLASVPAQVSLTLLLVIPPGVLAPGEHELSFSLTTASGATTWSLQASATVSDARLPVRGIIPLDAIVDAFGDALVEVACVGAWGQAILTFQETGP